MIFENNPKLKKVLSGLLLLVIAILVIVLIAPFTKTDKGNKVENKPQVVTQSAPVRTDYNGILPPGFLVNIPIENDTILSQSYSKKYIKQLQSSIVLYSPKSKDENYLFYENFLKVNEWIISKSLNGSTTASLVAKKDDTILDVVIFDRTGKTKYAKATTTPALSHVVINVIKKQ